MPVSDRLWVVRAYYANDVAPPKKPGDLAIEVLWTDEAGARMEEAAAWSRGDIGRVEVVKRRS
jgi:hypothetical protein